MTRDEAMDIVGGWLAQRGQTVNPEGMWQLRSYLVKHEGEEIRLRMASMIVMQGFKELLRRKDERIEDKICALIRFKPGISYEDAITAIAEKLTDAGLIEPLIDVQTYHDGDGGPIIHFS